METFTPEDLTLGGVAVVRILGIDPGTMLVGYGCLAVDERAAAKAGSAPLALLASNVVRPPARSRVEIVAAGALRLGRRGDPIEARLCLLMRSFAALLDDLLPHEVALEEAFHGKSVQSALRIGEARGVVLAESGKRGIPVHQYSPARIKRCVTGSGAAGKEAVAAMLRRLLPGADALEGDLPPDATDGLAVALTRAEERRSPLLGLVGS
ncbi:MAG: crossover junction endodeoxyribonuclease RuvC [Planctomycetota bacterium]